MIENTLDILANPSKFPTCFYNLFAAAILTSTDKLLISTVATGAPTTVSNMYEKCQVNVAFKLE
jgi:hypothetical protein